MFRGRFAASWVALAVVALLGLAPRAAMAGSDRPRTAGWLLGELAAHARAEAQAAGPGHPSDARSWQGWATQYEQMARNPDLAKQPALAFARANATGCAQIAAEATRFGATAVAALYRASIGFWNGLAAQLERGRALVITFPPEMLHPVPGLPGSPWADQAASRPVQQLVLCDGLASRARTCQARLAEMRHELAIGLVHDADPIVVQQTICDRAQEAYVGRCMK